MQAQDSMASQPAVSPETVSADFFTRLVAIIIDAVILVIPQVIIQVVLGHSSLATTARYTRVATKLIANLVSPLDQLETQSAPEIRRAKQNKTKRARRKAAA